jgi:hypothetical protein
MIVILKSPNADSRSAEEELTLEELSKSTESHVSDVEAGLQFFANALTDAGWNHDFTKRAYLEEFLDALKAGNIKESKWYKLHITRERHHLKSHVPEDVNLIDVLEQLTDCVMAGLARSGEIYDIDLPDELLQTAYKNTVELLKKQVEVASNE